MTTNPTPAMKMNLPMPVGNLDAYIQSAHRIPMLSESEEHELATRYQQFGDLDAARKMVMTHLRLVISIARNYLGYGLPHADLIQEGNIGLMKAVKRFDPARGVRLVSFAIHWIKAEIHEYIIKNWRLVKVATTKAQRKLFFNLRSLKAGSQTLNSQQVGDVARLLNVKPEEVVEMETRLSGRDIALENTGEESEEAFAPIDYLSDLHYEPTRVLAARERAWLSDEGLTQALQTLDARSRRIIESRWLAEETATLHELAAEFGVSAERIRQIETKAMQKMRTAMTR